MKQNRKTIRKIEDRGAALEKLRKGTFVDKNGCHIWQRSTVSYGYGSVSIEGVTWTAHRLAYELHYGGLLEANTSLGVLHKCDVPACCNPEHLYLGTQQQNARDRANRCRMKTGFRLFSRLSEDEANEPFGTVFYEYKEEIRTLHEWSQLFKLHPTTLQLRFDAGWSEADILSRPGHGVRRRKGVTQYRRFSGEAEVQRYLAEKDSAKTSS